MIAIRQATRIPLFFACTFFMVFAVQGIKAYNILKEKAAAQAAVTESVERWKQSYMALSDTVKKWDSNYRKDSTIQDLLSLYTLVGLADYGLIADTDGVVVHRIEQVTVNGVALGLTRICLASSSGSEMGALQVQGGNYQTLFAGLKRLAARPDIHIGTINIKGDRSFPVASLGDFCVLLRRV
ncbi:MAG: hypothetical protein D4S02_05995 [Rhodocyclaceae bacterium]|nr:hypothetical protein [Pseudomonadota bacterium]TRZ66931.1 MAG: hypothetical protein D4S02_05995 [Rhodocyclaceae bacterium]